MKFWTRVLGAVAAALAVAVMAVPAQGGGCRAVIHRNAVVEKVVVVEKAVAVAAVVPIVAQFVQVPLYSAIYTPQAYAPAVQAGYAAPAYSAPAAVASPAPAAAPCPDHSATFKQLASILKDVDSRLQRIEGGGTGQPPAQPAMPPADAPVTPPGKVPDPFNPPAAQQAPPGDAGRLLVLATKNCAACHDKARAQGAGKGFVLLESGRLAPLSPENLGKVIDELASGRMPKGGKMPDAERLEMIAAFVAGPSK